MTKGRLRDEMPGVAALIDDLRKGFGEAYIDQIIASGMRGNPVFSASENGRTVGTPVRAGVKVVRDEGGKHCIVVQADGTRTKDTGDAARRAPKKGDIEWK
jgi:hypothetical protein